jgi:glycerol kinase
VNKLILSIDQGTTSSRSILFDLKGRKVFSSQYEFQQIFPKPGWVEHNPEEIWKVTLKTIKESIKKSKKIKSKGYFNWNYQPKRDNNSLG